MNIPATIDQVEQQFDTRAGPEKSFKHLKVLRGVDIDLAWSATPALGNEDQERPSTGLLNEQGWRFPPFGPSGGKSHTSRRRVELAPPLVSVTIY